MATKKTMGGKSKEVEQDEIRTSREFGLAWDIFKDAVEEGVATNDLSGFGHVLLALLFASYPKLPFLHVERGPYDKPLRDKYWLQLRMRRLDAGLRSSIPFEATFHEAHRARHYDFMEALSLRSTFGRTMLHA